MYEFMLSVSAGECEASFDHPEFDFSCETEVDDSG